MRYSTTTRTALLFKADTRQQFQEFPAGSSVRAIDNGGASIMLAAVCSAGLHWSTAAARSDVGS